jgi:diguanylate cyclase (GGDEF)-like protein
MKQALLVEDNPDDAMMLKASLARSDVKSLEVTRVACLADAVDALHERRFDVVLLDLNLPDASGRACVEGIQQADARVPIVVLSGQSDEDYAVEILNRGVQDYLVKWEGDARIIMRAIRYAIERKRAELNLKYLARYDSLTGIPNRQYFQDQLQRAVNRARRSCSKLGLLFIDLDRFKSVNDTLGHGIGDSLLKAVVERLQESIRAGDVFARLGGDEFALLMEDIRTPLELEALACKLLESFRKPFAADGRAIAVTASIGIAVFPTDNSDAMGLLHNADIAMYQAKHKGRNGLQFFTSQMHEEILSYHRIETDLKRALEDQQFQLVYQPMVDLADRSLHSVEALLRWNHPERGLVSPDEFISVAEESGYIVPIGLWVLREACRQIKAWEHAGLDPPRVAINVAPVQFRQADFLRQLRQILREHAVSPSLIELELTESSLMENTDGIQRCLRELKAEGIRLSIDDFGTGYSCLNYLKTFPIDVIKIDRSFVTDIDDVRGAQAICAVILSIARSLSLESVAEGVTSERQLEFLIEHGCRFGQGFYFAEPAEPATIAGMLARSGRVPPRAARCPAERGSLSLGVK